MNIKITKAVISLGNFPLVVERSLDGRYQLALEQVASIINSPVEKLISFLDSQKVVKTDYISLTLAGKFWITEAMTGNINAQALAITSMIECIERRSDNIFAAENQTDCIYYIKNE